MNFEGRDSRGTRKHENKGRKNGKEKQRVDYILEKKELQKMQ